MNGRIFTQDTAGSARDRLSKSKMVKVVLENREVLHGIEDRLSTAVQDVVEGSVSLRSSQKKVLRNKLSQIASCFVQKIKRNTRVAGDDWSDAEDEEPPSKIAKKGASLQPPGSSAP